MSEIKEFKYDSLIIDGKVKYKEKYVRVESEIAFLKQLTDFVNNAQDYDDITLEIYNRIKQLRGGRDD